ncbi:MAG: hypothetical protein ACD_15C00001G0003 [uncultured bacterium]|nr:MAG: hypothetical protein ACD_15C00001G0003 [uncultured bacterium]KKP68898.1 MAG: hypothetical protein UR66_C0003G0163 [Candidatus Moranbacteria bacterium GW2011_GWE1_35_17]KKP72506.1 MAG: hypothetical protein UR65_C0014G0019 [Candidatus Moranbacteria bacterium GW2011_GWE2_35_164]KKP81754.1 MAG: hypothetical protein UR82_C0052G0002 [Candidatus Moranbacteria bacterium GW2011_GWF1_35_5]KKP84217.1 MAG: hypothetical protein UR83_C0025G0020 [Candidatus Moranbacteria bacterium GW2011_GWF2_35_54]
MKEFGNDSAFEINTSPHKASIQETANKTETSKETKKILSPQEKVLRILESESVFETINGHTVADIEALKNPALWKRNVNKRIGLDHAKFSPGVAFELLQGMEIIPKDEYEKALQEGRGAHEIPLFNIPASAKDAFDENKIKEKNYALDPWELYSQVPWEKIDTEAKNGDIIGGKELFLATEIFRKLRGHRNENGELMIFDKTMNVFKKITATKLRELGYLSTKDNNSITRTLIMHCPNLLESGLIKLTDFETITNDIGGEISRKEFVSSNPEKPFSVMIDSVRYYIGRNYFIDGEEKIPIQNIKVVILDNKSAGIVKMHNGREELVYTFDLLSNEEKEAKKKVVTSKNEDKQFSNADLSARTSIGKKEISQRLEKYSASAIIPQKKGEGPQKYAERLSGLARYDYVHQVTKKLSAEAGVGIHNLSWREQLQIAEMEYDSGVMEKDQRFMQFAKNYKLNGLRAFLSLEYGQEMGEKILKIGEKFDQSTADAIFTKYAELVDYAQKSGEYLAEQFNINDKDKAQKIAEHLLRRGKVLLSLCADEDLDLEKIYTKLDSIRGEVEIFTATLKSAKDDGMEIVFEIIKDLKIEEKTITKRNNLTQEEKDKLTKIFSDNYKDIFAENPVAYERVLKDFEAEIDDLEGQTVYVMKYKNEIIAFCRFAPISKREVYGGSLNVSKDVQGLSVGDYFIGSTLEKVSREYDIKIKTRKDNPANSNYQKKGFLIIGTHKENDGVEYLDMLLPAKNQLQKAA